MLESLIVRTYAFWSLLWLVLLVIEWVRGRRFDRMLSYFGIWFAGGVVLVAARLILT